MKNKGFHQKTLVFPVLFTLETNAWLIAFYFITVPISFIP